MSKARKPKVSPQTHEMPEPCQLCFWNALDADLTADQAENAFLEYRRRLQAGTWVHVPDDELLHVPYLDDSMTAGEWRDLGSHGEHIVIREEIRRNNLLNQLFEDCREIIPDDETIRVQTDDNRVKIFLTFGDLRKHWPDMAEAMEDELNRDGEGEEGDEDAQ